MSLILPAVLGGRYELLEEIGNGAYAAVYRAHDHVLDRVVAVKVLRDEITSDETFARFEREVHVTATLEHAHILHVHDSGKHEGRPYIVTEFAPGGTLSDKMARHGQLQMADALQITCEVGIALAHAHASGVVHRDVKPDNILLGRGGVLLADFGIAISDTDEFRTRLTRSGMAVGTVQYMSPEQLCAERDIDGRSDQYALACILYEMLAGVRPHLASTVEGLRLQRLAGQHLPVRAHRPNVPEQVDAAIHKALCSMAADRHRDIPTFLSALGMAGSGEFALMSTSAVLPTARTTDNATPTVEPSGLPGSARPAQTLWSLRMIGVLGLTGALAVAAVAYATKDGASGAPAASDRTRVLLPSPERTDPLSPDSRVHDALREELAAWPSVERVGRLTDGDTSTLRLQPSVASIGDSVRVSLRVRRGSNGLEQRIVSAAILDDNASLRELAAQLVLEALAGVSGTEAPGMDDLPVRSTEALTHYVEAHRFLRRGVLDSASRAFRDAARVTSTEPRFAQAHYWAAQSDAWRDPRNSELWQGDVEMAFNSGRMHGLDSVLTSALQLMARADYPAACAQYRVASTLDPTSFVAWYGLGDCARVDAVVEVRDGQPRFRSSLWSALSAYRSAIETAPSPSLLATLFPQILQTTFAEGNRARAGVSMGPNVNPYRALPSLFNDTIAFHPIAQSAMEQMGGRTIPATYEQALRRGRAVALDLTEQWLSRTREASEAWYYRAFALELAGRLDADAGEMMSAQRAIERAALGARSADLRARIAVARTRILVRQGQVERAVQVAREALNDTAGLSPDSAALLAPLAAVVGDLALVEFFSSPTERQDLPSALVGPLDAFNARAWLGECAGLDSLRTVIDQRTRSSFSPSELRKARLRWIASAYRDAVPCLGPTAIAEFEPQIPLDHAYRALAAGNSAEARRILGELRAERVGASSSAMSWDFVFAEAWTMAQAGDSAGARQLLVNALDAIASMNGFTMDYVKQAAALRRGLLLLRELCKDVAVSSDMARWADRAEALMQTKSRGGDR